MSKKKAAKAVAESEFVVFVGEPGLAPGKVALHRGEAGEVVRSLQEVKEDWRRIASQVAEMVSSANEDFETIMGFELSEIELSLAFSAKGKLAFIAEAGAEASVTLKICRKAKA